MAVNFPLSSLAHKFNTTSISLINEVLTYVNTHIVTSTANEGIVKWNKLGGRNGTGLFRGQFMDLHIFVSTELARSLSISQVYYLVTYTGVGVAVKIFYAANGGNEYAVSFFKTAVNLMINTKK